MLNYWNKAALYNYNAIAFTNTKDFLEVVQKPNCTGTYSLYKGDLPSVYHESHRIRLHYYLGMLHSFTEIFNDVDRIVLQPGINCNTDLCGNCLFFVFGVQVTGQQRNKLRHKYIHCESDIESFNLELAQVAVQNHTLVQEIRQQSTQQKVDNKAKIIHNLNNQFQNWKANRNAIGKVGP